MKKEEIKQMKEGIVLLGAIILSIGILIIGIGQLFTLVAGYDFFISFMPIGAFIMSLGGIIAMIGIIIPDKLIKFGGI